MPVALGLVALFGRSVADIATGRGPGFLDSFAGLVFFLLVGRLFQQKAFDRIAFDRTCRSFLPLSVACRARTAAGGRRPSTTSAPAIASRSAPHEVVPADAVLLDAAGTIDYAFVTGESTPVAVSRGDASGPAAASSAGAAARRRCSRVAQHRAGRLWTTRRSRARAQPLADRRVGALRRLVHRGRRSAWRSAAPSAWWPDTAMAVQVATAVLIIACPCALTLAAPVTLGTAMGDARRAPAST